MLEIELRVGAVKTPLRDPKIDREWRTTLILAGVVALLCVAVVIVAASRYFLIRGAGREAGGRAQVALVAAACQERMSMFDLVQSLVGWDHLTPQGIALGVASLPTAFLL